MAKFIGWVPTQPEFIDIFFEICTVSSLDVVYDLGSGDGRLLFAALDKGAGQCVGIDIDPERIKVSKETAKLKGLENRVTFKEADIMDVDLSPASVILCYIYSSASAALKPKLEKELKSGTKVVMESFPVHGWKPLKITENNGRSFYFYIMPPEPTEETGEYTGDYWNYDGY
jgi:SAM-dependent methyltransferase